MNNKTFATFALASAMLFGTFNPAFSQREVVNGSTDLIERVLLETLIENVVEPIGESEGARALVAPQDTSSGNCTVSDVDMPGQRLYVRGSDIGLLSVPPGQAPQKLGKFIASVARGNVPSDTAIIIVDDFGSEESHGHSVFTHTTALFEGAGIELNGTAEEDGHLIARFADDVFVVSANTRGSLPATRGAIDGALDIANAEGADYVVVNMSFVIVPCALKDAFDTPTTGGQPVPFEEYYGRLMESNELLLCELHLEMTQILRETGQNPPADAVNLNRRCQERRGAREGRADIDVRGLKASLRTINPRAIQQYLRRESSSPEQIPACADKKSPLCRIFLTAVLNPPSVVNAPFQEDFLMRKFPNFRSVAFVASAGNYALPYAMYPAAWPGVVAVSSCDIAQNGDCEKDNVTAARTANRSGAPQAVPRRSDFSNLGTVIAPGASFNTSPGGKNLDAAYEGTSFSAPAVSVYLAFVLSSYDKCALDMQRLPGETPLSDLGSCLPAAAVLEHPQDAQAY